MASDDFQFGMKRLTGLLAAADAERTLRDMLQLVELAALPADASSIVVIDRDDGRISAHSSDRARVLDEAQQVLGEGPTVEVLRDQRRRYLGDAREDDRWPEFRREMIMQGLVCVLCVPLVVEGGPIGALTMYSGLPGGLENGTSERAARVGAHLVGHIATQVVYDECSRLVEELSEALGSRAVIEQAKGILMERRQCTADEAFRMLRDESQRRNLKLRDVAQKTVDSLPQE